MISIKKQPSLAWEISYYFQKFVPKWILYLGKEFSKKKNYRGNSHTLENHRKIMGTGNPRNYLYLQED